MPRCAPDIRMPVLIAIVHVRRPMVLEVSPRTLDAIVKTSPPNIAAVLVWTPRPRLVVVSRGRRPLLRLHSSHSKRRQSQTNQYRHRSYFCSHVPSLPFF